jgi:uncharacterized protein YbjT (DUF2867 family)
VGSARACGLPRVRGTVGPKSTFFAEWLKTYWELRDGQGHRRLPFGEGRHAPITSVDQGHVIAPVLPDPEPHDRAVYTLHGPVVSRMSRMGQYP